MLAQVMRGKAGVAISGTHGKTTTTAMAASVFMDAGTDPSVLIGGVSATVAFAGLSPQFVGVNQVNVVVPANAPKGDKVSLQISVGGLTSTNQVTMAVQ